MKALPEGHVAAEDDGGANLQKKVMLGFNGAQQDN